MIIICASAMFFKNLIRVFRNQDILKRVNGNLFNIFYKARLFKITFDEWKSEKVKLSEPSIRELT